MTRHTLNRLPTRPLTLLALVGAAWLAPAGAARAESVPPPDVGNYCSTSEECATSHDGRRCLPERGYCGCDSNDDCDPVSQICNQDERRCQVAECRADADCASNPRGTICDVAVGRCGCTGHEQCASNQACLGGSCAVVDCRTDKDCVGRGNGPHCDQTGFYCTCQGDAECSDSPQGLGCNYGACGCYDDTQCREGAYCGKRGGQCRALCQTSNDCTYEDWGLRCTDGRCGCQSDADCDYGSCYDDGRCGPPREPDYYPDGGAGVWDEGGGGYDGGPVDASVETWDDGTPRVDASVGNNGEQGGPSVAGRSSGCNVGSGPGDSAPPVALALIALLGIGLLRRRGSSRR